LFLGCDGDDHRLVSLDGTWVSQYGELFIINLVNKTYNMPDPWGGSYSVEGNISEIVYFKSNIGIIFVQITAKGSDFVTSGSGNFTGVHFKYLDNTTVEFSTASTGVYPNASTPVYSTLAAAKQTLNENTLGTYFAYGSACTKN
jgi:hypothetical protein